MSYIQQVVQQLASLIGEDLELAYVTLRGWV